MTHKRGEEFIQLLASQLENASFHKETSRERLERALRASVEGLPDRDLRAEVAENLNQYVDKLRRLLEDIPGSSKDVSGCLEDGRREGWPIISLTTEGLKEYLSMLRDVEEPLHSYERLAFCCHSNTNQLVLILRQWSQALGVRVAVTVEAVEVCTLLTAGAPCTALLPWLRFCYDVLSAIAEWVLSGERGGGDGGGVTVGELEGTETSSPALIRCLLHVLTVAHLRKQTNPPPFKSSLHSDLLSGLASVVLDLTIRSSSAEETIAAVHSSVCAILGRDELLDAVLQVKSYSGSASATVLLPLISKILKFHGERTSPSTAHFVKLICCCNKATELAVFSTAQHLCSELVPATEKWVPPPELCQWLWATHPSLCQSLGLKVHWSTGRHTRFLLRKLSPQQTEQLYEVAFNAQRVDGDRRLKVSAAGRRLNEQDMQATYMAMEDNDESSTEDASGGIFCFMDTAGSGADSSTPCTVTSTGGSVEVETSSGMDLDEEVHGAGLIPGKSVQRLDLEDCSDDGIDQASNPVTEFMDPEEDGTRKQSAVLCDQTLPVPETRSPTLVEPRVLRSHHRPSNTTKLISVRDAAIRKKRKKHSLKRL